jgi:hypothetical protein
MCARIVALRTEQQHGLLPDEQMHPDAVDRP